MRIRVRCPRCWQTAEITEDQLGKSGVCNRCGSPVKIPARLNHVCFVCGTDIAKGKHYKDEFNNYLCGPCFSERKVAERSAFSVDEVECEICHARFNEGEGFEVNGKAVCASCHSHGASAAAPGALSSLAEPTKGSLALHAPPRTRNRPSADDSGVDMESIIDEEPLPRRKGEAPPQPPVPAPVQASSSLVAHDDQTVVPAATGTTKTIVRTSPWPGVVAVMCLVASGVLAMVLLARNTELSQRLASTESTLSELRKTVDATHDAMAKRHQDNSDQFEQQRRQMDKFRGEVQQVLSSYQQALGTFQQSLTTLQAAARQPVVIVPPPTTQPVAVNNTGAGNTTVRNPVVQPATKPASIFEESVQKPPATTPVQPHQPNIFDETNNMRRPAHVEPKTQPQPKLPPGSQPSRSIFD